MTIHGRVFFHDYTWSMFGRHRILAARRSQSTSTHSHTHQVRRPVLCRCLAYRAGGGHSRARLAATLPDGRRSLQRLRQPRRFRPASPPSASAYAAPYKAELRCTAAALELCLRLTARHAAPPPHAQAPWFSLASRRSRSPRTSPREPRSASPARVASSPRTWPSASRRRATSCAPLTGRRTST